MNIEQDIPIPSPRGQTSGARRKFPFNTLAVGESFVTSSESIRQTASFHNRTSGKRFTVRKLEDRTFRVWRVA